MVPPHSCTVIAISNRSDRILLCTVRFLNREFVYNPPRLFSYPCIVPVPAVKAMPRLLTGYGARVHRVIHGGDDFIHRNIAVAVLITIGAPASRRATQGDIHRGQDLIDGYQSVAVAIAGAPDRHASVIDHDQTGVGGTAGEWPRRRSVNRILVSGSGAAKVLCRGVDAV
jgi:hypothetical protein